LVCEDEVLARRLKSRPDWRGSSAAEYIQRHVSFNGWLKANAQSTEPPMALLDTSDITVDESVERVHQWMNDCLE
jgi:hypothetical protein